MNIMRNSPVFLYLTAFTLTYYSYSSSSTTHHRWVMGETQLFGLHLWFRLHMALQLSGMVCFIVGFAYAWLYLPGPGNGYPTGGNVGLAHMYLGSIVMGLACLQVIVGFIRPKPDSQVRPQWNMLHHWLGRLTIVSAWTTLYMGIWIAHASLTYQASYMYWLVPAAVVSGALVLADLALTLLGPSQGSAAGQQSKIHPSSSAAEMVAVVSQKQDGRSLQ